MTSPNAAQQRCTLHDLLPGECPCSGRDGGEAAAKKTRQRLLDHPATFPSLYPGACGRCGESFAVGDPIRSGAHRFGAGWLGPCCLEEMLL